MGSHSGNNCNELFSRQAYRSFCIGAVSLPHPYDRAPAPQAPAQMLPQWTGINLSAQTITILEETPPPRLHTRAPPFSLSLLACITSCDVMTGQLESRAIPRVNI